MVNEKIKMAYQYSLASKHYMRKQYLDLFNSLPESKRTKKTFNDILNSIRDSEIRDEQLLQKELDKIRIEEGFHNGANLLSKIVLERNNHITNGQNNLKIKH